MNYLFVGAHPDDIEISAMGFLIKLLENKNNVTMLVVTSHEDLRIREMRIEEQEKVFNYLSNKYPNFKGRYLNFVDGSLLYDIIDLKNIIEKVVTDIDIIVTHFGKDTHIDHETLSKACDIAGRKISVLNFESPNNYDFIPNFFVPLNEEELNLKIELMKLHDSQNIKNNNFYLDKIKATAIFRGQAVYEKYAEAFYIKRLKSPIVY